jgi:hypothetical protein
MPTSLRIAAALLAAGLFLVEGRAAAPKFYPDDPIARDPETQDASDVPPYPISEQFDFVENSFLGAGDRTPKRAVNVNTIDEVPDSSWFTRRTLSLEQLATGPDRGTGPAPGVWTIIRGKSEGITPGMTIRDTAGDVYFVKFDPPANAEMASGAEVISTKFFHAFGYHVPENYVATLRRDNLAIDPSAMVEDDNGRKRRMDGRDVEAVLKKAAVNADGTFRVVASKALQGTPLGPFRYHGTRPDDPNDIFPHEHRRELRGLLVFAAWLNHDDSRSGNTLDTLVADGTRKIVRHHLIDFGSTLGSGSTRAQAARAGNEYLWESRPTLITMLTLGFYVRPWIKVRYAESPAIGRFESSYFLPEEWKPEYPNPAFINARADDRFWAARAIAAVPDEGVRAVVRTARFSDPGATAYMIETLLARKRKVLLAWLNGTNPVVEPALSQAGVLTFENAAEAAGVAQPAERYTVEWSRFDNATGSSEAAGEAQTVTAKRAQAPAALLASRPEFIAVRLRAFHAERPDWNQPLTLHFQRAETSWRLVGLERMP